MFDQIIYITRYGVEEKDITPNERIIVKGLQEAGKILDIPVRHYHQTRNVCARDLYVSLGGDGTMLTAMRTAVRQPEGTVLGINFGTLGFLTSFDGNILATESTITSMIVDLFQQNQESWKLEYRSILTAEFPINTDATDSLDNRIISAVNEILITTPTRRNPLEYDVFVDDNYVATQRGDGVIVATATGSTAYAMSAGGAIMCPSTRAMQIVPLAAHTLTSRPIVVGEHSNVRIIPKFTNRVKEVEILYDGLHTYTASKDINFNVQICNDQAVGVWRTKIWNFFDVLREKMNWGS